MPDTKQGMITMKKITSMYYFLILSILMLLTSCATIITGGNPKIIIDGNVNEPVTIITEKEVYNNVKLPYQVKVSRHKIDGQRITIKSDKYDYRDIMLEKRINEWAYGNILFGGLMGWGVDLITNCVSKPNQTRFYIEGTKKTENNE